MADFIVLTKFKKRVIASSVVEITFTKSKTFGNKLALG